MTSNRLDINLMDFTTELIRLSLRGAFSGSVMQTVSVMSLKMVFLLILCLVAYCDKSLCIPLEKIVNIP